MAIAPPVTKMALASAFNIWSLECDDSSLFVKCGVFSIATLTVVSLSLLPNGFDKTLCAFIV
jgi:hypothetical protein